MELRELRLREFKGMPVGELMHADIPPTTYIVDKIIPRGGLTFLYGPPGGFKTNFGLYVSLCIVKGNNVFNFNVVQPVKICWIDEENREVGMHDKIVKLTKGMNIDDINGNFWVYYSNDFDILRRNYSIIGEDDIFEGDLDVLERLIKEHGFELVIIDSIAKVFPLSERDEKDVRRIFSALKPMMVKYGTTFVLIHHTRKLAQGQSVRNMEDIAGSREFAGMADSMIYIQEIGNGKFMIKQTKNRNDKCAEPINFEVEGDRDSLSVKYVGTVDENIKSMAEQIGRAIMVWVEENPQDVYLTGEIKDIMKEQGYADTNTSNAIKWLTNKRKFFKRVKMGQYKVRAK